MAPVDITVIFVGLLSDYYMALFSTRNCIMCDDQSLSCWADTN
jgi:hypothetical protein